MIGLSLLPSPHPEAFQRLTVRTSRRSHPSFILDKGRSLGFASASADSAPSSDSLSLRLRASSPLTSPATATRRFIMQKARGHTAKGCSHRLKAHGFRVCFTPLLEVLFTFPSRYLSTIGLSVVFSLAGWAPQIPAEFLVLRGTQVPACLSSSFRVRACHPLRIRFPQDSATLMIRRGAGPTTPGAA